MAPCCISNCKNRKEIHTKTNSGVTYHLFPKDPERRLEWIKAIGRKNWNPTQVVVCSDHFEKNCFYTTDHGLRKLVEGATPSVNLRKRTVKEDDPQNIFNSSLLLNIPIITEEDTLKTKQLALQLQHLVIIYEKQKRKIKNLRQKYIRRKEMMRRQRQRNHRDNNTANIRKCKNVIDTLSLDSDDDVTETLLLSDPL